MSEDVFTEPDGTDDEWVDVRMTDPEEGEWDIDALVVGGQVEYVDLRVRPALLTGFVDCLVGDVSEERARGVLADVARRNGIEFPDGDGEQSTGEQ